MSTEKLWTITVIIGFSLLLTLAYFVATTMTEENIVDRTDTGLKNAIEKFQKLKETEQVFDDSNLDT